MAKRLLVALCLAGTVATALPATPAAAEGTCPPGFIQAPFPPGVTPDRNGNGLVCFRLVARGARLVLIDDVGPGI